MAWWSAWLEAKLEARAGVHVRHLCCWPVITPLSRQSSTVHTIGVGHFFVKMCQFITWYLSWMHGWICFITARKSLHCSSCKRYTLASWAEYRKDGNVSVLKEDHPPWLTLRPTYCHYAIEHITFFLLSMECIISSIFNKKSKAEFHPYQICHLNIKRNNCCFEGCLSFFYNLKKMTLSKIWIMTLVTTMDHDLGYHNFPPFWVLESTWLYNHTLGALISNLPSSFHYPLLP